MKLVLSQHQLPNTSNILKIKSRVGENQNIINKLKCCPVFKNIIKLLSRYCDALDIAKFLVGDSFSHSLETIFGEKKLIINFLKVTSGGYFEKSKFSNNVF